VPLPRCSNSGQRASFAAQPPVLASISFLIAYDYFTYVARLLKTKPLGTIEWSSPLPLVCKSLTTMTLGLGLEVLRA
jgi:hypothetical protein